MFGAVIRFLARVARYAYRELAALDYRLTRGGGTEAGHASSVLKSAAEHDMYRDADERYYREQYWYWIGRALSDMSHRQDVVGLDLGCGQGRLTTLLCQALSGGRVTAVDLSETAVASARKYAKELGVRNVEFCVSPIRETLQACAADSVDVLLMTEVTFFYPQWRKDLEEMKRVLRPSGIVCIAFRSQYYDALCIVKEGMLEQTQMLIASRQGRLFGGDIEFTWQTSSEVRRLLRDELGLRVLELVGIGCCSGIVGDPHAAIVRPSLLDEADRNELMRLELAMGAEFPDAGRYILAIASKC